LLGVVADASSGGAALISVDGQPARPFAVGTSLDGRLVLQSVSGRRAVLATDRNGPAELTLELPALAK
jgi:general secretion pathway protein C